MILYMDTSALVKAYIAEDSSAKVMLAIQHADIIATHLIAYIEAHSAFSRLKREKKINDTEFDTIKTTFVRDWENYFQIENSKNLMQHAVDFSEAFGLRAYDSVHLAAAVLLARQSKQSVTFAC